MSKLTRHCNHCNNTSPYEIVFETTVEKLWEDGTYWSKSGEEPWVRGGWLTQYVPYLYCVVQCSTCGHLSMLGEFDPLKNSNIEELIQLYPTPSELSISVPESVRTTYLEAASIRVRAPHAYVGQIRKALELICSDQRVSGNNLHQRLVSLATMGILPTRLAETSDLIRQIGNVGVHSENYRISILDTELIDEFFRAVIEYVYIAPAKIAELKRRIAHEKEPPDDTIEDDIPF